MTDEIDKMVAKALGSSSKVIEAIIRLIEADPHQWSTRPCRTCVAVSALIDRPFGCNKRAVEAQR